MTPSRSAAFHILGSIAKSRGNSDALLHSAQVTALSNEDRNLTTALVLGVLRWQIVLDTAIRRHLARPDALLPDEAAIAMRLGAFQIMFLERVPVHAAINESVELVKHSFSPHTAGLVNAVLRKIANDPMKARENTAERAHPGWLVARWKKRYGETATRSICEYNQAVPPTTVRMADASVEARLREDEIEFTPSSILKCARTIRSPRFAASAAFKSGLVRVQDEGSQLVVELAGCGTRILDCCAAPGGKTAILAEKNPHSSVLACDINPERLNTMKRLLAKNATLRGIVYRQLDAEKLPADLREQFDLVLCDAPCSGTGTLARNPEIRHRLSAADLGEQQSRQGRILRGAMQAVKPGGQVLYSTCSLEPEENDDVVNLALAEHKQFVQVDIGDRLAELESCGQLVAGAACRLSGNAVKSGRLHLLPGTHGCDGFFAAILRRLN